MNGEQSQRDGARQVRESGSKMIELLKDLLKVKVHSIPRSPKNEWERRTASVRLAILAHLLLLTERPAALTPQRTLETNIPIDRFHPLIVGPGGRIRSEEDVHLLERKSLSLRDIEPDESGAHEAEETEDDVSAVSDAAQHIRRDLADDKVVHPVGGGAEGDAVGAVGHGPDFCDEDPGAGAPGVAEVDDEEPDHGNWELCEFLARWKRWGISDDLPAAQPAAVCLAQEDWSLATMTAMIIWLGTGLASDLFDDFICLMLTRYPFQLHQWSRWACDQVCRCRTA